jgi:outer membrane protein OmpA-like peptidoglycan-associated protein
VPPPPKVKVEDHASSAKVDIMTVEPAVGTRIRLDNIFFDFDKATLKAESQAEIDKVTDLLTDYPLLRIEIEAHTDDQGSDAYNLKLSEDRAKAVVDALVKEKIDVERLAWKGYGETKPLAPNTTEEGRAKNRRVEFRVVER